MSRLSIPSRWYALGLTFGGRPRDARERLGGERLGVEGDAVRVLQPTALLRAGVIDVAQFALYDEAEVRADGLAGSLRLEPVPLCVGAPFRGTLTMTHGVARRPSRCLDDRRLPTVRTPHGRADAAFHVILATAWARDPHLVRDVAVCSTTEL